MEKKEKKVPEGTVKHVKKEKPSRLVYIGPASLKDGLSSDVVFKGGIPKTAEAFFEKYPLAKSLLVDLSKFPESKAKLNQKGSAEHITYEKLERQMRGGVR